MQRVIANVISRHVEEAAIIWLRRHRMVGEPYFSLGDLEDLDRQLAAHLDGLRIAGDAGWAVCLKEMRSGYPDDLFPAAVAAFESGHDERIKQVLSRAEGNRPQCRAVVSALGWLPYEQVVGHIASLLKSDSSAVRRIGIAAVAVHRHDPGAALDEALADAEPVLRARALRAIGELGLVERLPQARAQLDDKDENCRLWAAWSTALLSHDETAVAVLKQVVETGSDGVMPALQLALRRINPQSATNWLMQLAPDSNTARWAVIGAGVLGDPALLPWLVEQMQVPPLARVAGEAFGMITGLDLLDAKLEVDEPAGFSAGPNEDPQDENVEMDPDENLPWPNQPAIANRLAKHGNELKPGTRYLLGRPIEESWCEDVLRNGFQRQRAAAALELCILQPGRELFEVRAPGSRQMRILASR